MKRRLFINILICGLLTAFIFGNSIDNPVESSAISSFVAELLRPFFDLFLDTNSFNFNHFIRKLAHFAEFAALGVSVCLTVKSVVAVFKKSIRGYSLFYLLFVAVIDEYIQIFFGRGSSVADVLLDFSGAVFGFALVYVVRSLASYFKKLYFKLSNPR